jgi:hypothetical protein
LADPKYTDADQRRFSLPYVPAAEQGESYLQKRFAEIRERQKTDAAARLKNVIQRKFAK